MRRAPVTRRAARGRSSWRASGGESVVAPRCAEVLGVSIHPRLTAAGYSTSGWGCTRAAAVSRRVALRAALLNPLECRAKRGCGFGFRTLASGGALELGAKAISGLRRDASADGRPGRRTERIAARRYAGA